MLEADAIATAVRIQGIEQAVYSPAEADSRRSEVVERLGSAASQIWQRAAWLQPWQVIVELGSGLGEMMLAVPLPPGSRLVAVEPNSADLPYLQRSISEFDTTVELIEAESGGLDGLGELASRASGPGAVSSACFRIAWPLDADQAMKELDPILARFTKWAVVVTLSGLGPEKITELARGRFAFLIDKRTGNLVRLGSGRSEAAVSRMLDSGWLYSEEAVLLSTAELAGTW